MSDSSFFRGAAAVVVIGGSLMMVSPKVRNAYIQSTGRNGGRQVVAPFGTGGRATVSIVRR